MISVTLFVGLFDMRVMQAAMNKGPDESKSGDLLYDHLDGKDELSFDIMADAGDYIQIHAHLHMSSIVSALLSMLSSLLLGICLNT
uniref:Uncharacterized protein n=1 Tax=Triticum urartu TaxID=4572 RepID=A0A8R7PYR6_TRIUA